MEHPTQALVLAAGLGSRMAPITDHTPKPLLPFFCVPLLDLAVGKLVDADVSRIAINTHHLAAAVADHVKSSLASRYPDVSFHLSHEATIRGTGGALDVLRDWFQRGPFWVVNSDAVFDQDLKTLSEWHQLAGHDATLMVTRDPAHRALRFLSTGPEGFLRERTPEATEDGAAFCGVHLNSWSLLDVLPRGEESCVLRQGHLPWAAQGARVALFETRQFWADLGTPERYLGAHNVAYRQLCRPRAIIR